MPTQVSLPSEWGEAWLYSADEHRPAALNTRRSYDHRGTQLVWAPPAQAVHAACDLENVTRPNEDMAAIFEVDSRDFTARWVATEVLAKIHATPILVWLRQNGLAGAAQISPDHGVSLLVKSLNDGTVVGFGWSD